LAIIAATQKLQQMLEKTLLWRIYLRDSEDFLRSLYAAYSVSAVRRWRSFQQRTYCSILPTSTTVIDFVNEITTKMAKLCVPGCHVLVTQARNTSQSQRTWRAVSSAFN